MFVETQPISFTTETQRAELAANVSPSSLSRVFLCVSVPLWFNGAALGCARQRATLSGRSPGKRPLTIPESAVEPRAFSFKSLNLRNHGSHG
jgi:hypothetical protein